MDALRQGIVEQIGIATERLGADCTGLLEDLRQAADDQEIETIASEIGEQLRDHGADHELQAILGSWRDTIDDDMTFRHLKSYNENGTIFTDVICRIDPDQ